MNLFKQYPARKRNNSSKIPYKGQVHTPKSQFGLGDYYGTGIPAKLAKIHEPTQGYVPMSKKQLKTPPKSLA
jgi:hypothetical protein